MGATPAAERPLQVRQDVRVGKWPELREQLPRPSRILVPALRQVLAQTTRRRRFGAIVACGRTISGRTPVEPGLAGDLASVLPSFQRLDAVEFQLRSSRRPAWTR